MENPTPPSAPLFQQTPPASPPPRRGKSPLTIALIIAGIVIVVVAGLAALAVPAYKRVREQAFKLAEETRKKKLEQLARPLTEEEKTKAQAFAVKLISALQNADSAQVQAMTDLAELADEVFHGLNSAAEMKKGFIDGVEEAPGGILSNLLGQRGHFVRHHVREGIPVVTLRFLDENAAATYVDLFLKRDGKGGFMAMDLYTYLFGTRSSSEVRRAVAMMHATDNTSLAEILGIPTAESRETMVQLTGYASSQSQGDFRAVVEKYGRLKPELQKLPFTYSIYIQALQRLSDQQPEMNEAYANALEKARGILGEDVTIDLLMVDMHFIRGDMQAARKDVENALKTIGDDSYLHHLVGLMCARTDDLAGAEAALAKAEKIQPDLIDLVDLRMMILAMKKDYAGIVKSMEDFKAKTGAKLTPDLLSEKVYDGFKKSPEFTKWAAEAAK